MVMCRGYGSSEGSPSERGLKMDARAALTHLRQRDDVDPDNIVVFGRSLGGAVAIDLVAEQQDYVKAMVVENTFTSIPDMAKKMFPILSPFLSPASPIPFFIRDKWRSIDKIPKIKVPILMLASEKDEMVPFAHMQQLRAAQRSPCCEWTQLDAYHMTAFQEQPTQYWTAIRDFFEANVY